jgi:Astacin (Peptidase family M12A)
MTQSDAQLRYTLRRIADLAANAAQDGPSDPPGNDVDGRHQAGRKPYAPALGNREPIVCTTKTLPTRLLVAAAATAKRIYPGNAPMVGPVALAGLEPNPLRIAIVTKKYWGKQPRRFTVSFLEPAEQALRARILAHMNAWNRTTGISFAETQHDGDVRISFGPGGYWSYIGTDILHIPADRPTMNLEAFSMDTREEEYARVVRHETGHTLGFPHEHMRRQLVARLDKKKAYKYFLATQGWDKQTVDEQVLTPLDDASLMETPPDQTSIMCYQLPGSITIDGKPILGGVDINSTDYAFAAEQYPKAAAPRDDDHDCGSVSSGPDDEWPESEDVQVTRDRMYANVVGS